MVSAKSIRSFFRLSAWTVLFLASPVAGSLGAAASFATSPRVTNSRAHAVEKVSAAPPGRFADIDELRLYAVIHGEKHLICLDRLDLENRRDITCKGYICGVELLSRSKHLSAAIGAHPLSILGHKADVHTLEGPAPSVAAGPAPSTALYRYAYFPTVPGDAVSVRNHFSISINGVKARYHFLVQQRGYHPLAAIEKPFPAPHGDKLIFRYLGGNIAAFESAIPDFKDRINAIAQGVERVEKAAGVELVSYVDILHYSGVNNALSARGQNQIWIYETTFRHLRCRDLRCMGEHETLHRFVDRRGYTHQQAIRRFFSYLYGFAPLSLERFSLITRGTVTPAALPPPDKRNPFFAFINERNFIPGMTGGHSGDNLDEFCVSFLHSLLYFHQFERNLGKSELITSNGKGLKLSPQARQRIRRCYRGALEVFMAAGEDTPSPPRASVFYSSQQFEALAKSLDVTAPPTVSPRG